MRDVVEIWRVIEEAPNYEVSNLGNIRHIVRKINRKPQDNGKGYKYIAYKDNGKTKHVYIHIAVAKAFIPNPDNLPQVGHLDETRDNNTVSNLYWTTAKDNCNMPKHLERMSVSRGIPCRCIETGEIFCSIREAARQKNLHQGSITKCCKGKQKTCGKYHWQYAEREE